MDFEAMIRDAQKNGLTIDDIAKQFSKTLNAVEQEDQRKRSVTDKREAVLDKLERAFHENVTKGQLGCSDAAALFTLTMAEKYPNWTAENIKDYFQIVKLNAEAAATMIDKEPDELLQILLGKVDKLFDTIPKSKDKSDNEKIADFLRKIGL